MWNVITMGKKGYSHHPEPIRWKGKLRAMYKVHDEIAQEMSRRGFNHRSPLDKSLAIGKTKQDKMVDSIEHQREILKSKGCTCRTD